MALAALIGAAVSHAAEPLAPLFACRAVADPAARLACFDHESANLAGAPAAAMRSNAAAPGAPSVAPGAPPVAAPASSSKENFGLSEGTVSKKEVAAGTRPAELKNIQAHVTAVSSTGTGFTTFTLDNGQVWREITPGGDLLAKPGQTVTVSVGLFHSYWLQSESGRGCKVTRIL
jgi:hypothetical protein